MIALVKNWMVTQPRVSNKIWAVLACLSFSFCFFMFEGGKVASMLFVIVLLLSLYLVMGRWSGVASAKGTRILRNVEKDMVIEAGTSVSVEVNLQIPGVWPIPYVKFKDRLLRRNGEQVICENAAVLDWKRRCTVEYRTPPLGRGFYHFSESECVTEDILGLFEHKGSLEMPHSFSVLPQTVNIKEWHELHKMNKGQHHHATTTRAQREITQINGIREYIYGDRISRIHWNATAKTGTWKSKEFEREALPKTIILLDRNKQAYRNKAQFELAVSTTASLLEYGRQRDLAFGLLSVGSNSVYFEPKRSLNQHKSILNHLIDVEADGRHPVMNVIKDRVRHLVQGCFFVIISPQKDDAMLNVLNWINHRQMNPCHLYLNADTDHTKQEEWIRKLKLKGYQGYGINSLQELSQVFGGRMG